LTGGIGPQNTYAVIPARRGHQVGDQPVLCPGSVDVVRLPADADGQRATDHQAESQGDVPPRADLACPRVQEMNL
jgi:hypothetical protein